jgi:hypothetical protein
VSNNFVFTENGNFDHCQAFTHLDYASACDQVRVGRLAYEVDVQTGGDCQLDFAEQAQNHRVHTDIGEHHHEGSGNGAARSNRVVAIRQHHLRLTWFDAVQVNARIGCRGQFAGNDCVEGFDADFAHDADLTTAVRIAVVSWREINVDRSG